MIGTHYRIVIKGRLGEDLAGAFDGMAVAVENGTTVLEGYLVDQTQLYGVLDRLRDLALELLRVERMPA